MTTLHTHFEAFRTCSLLYLIYGIYLPGPARCACFVHLRGNSCCRLCMPILPTCLPRLHRTPSSLSVHRVIRSVQHALAPLTKSCSNNSSRSNIISRLQAASQPQDEARRRSMVTQEAAPDVAYDQQWLDHWKKGVPPGQMWDAGKVSPMLAKLLHSGQLHVAGKKVLVPGCGRGYDVFAFAVAGASHAVGLDLSEEAIAAAKAERDIQLAGHRGVLKRAELVADNFFTYVHHTGELFDYGYDYTFLCALHPDMRQAWAAAWARALAPGAELLTLVFPVGPGFIGNPPWQVSPELYQELLIPAGFEQLQLEPIPAELSHKGRNGREWLGRWRRLSSSSSSSKKVEEDASTQSTSTAVAASRI